MKTEVFAGLAAAAFFAAGPTLAQDQAGPGGFPVGPMTVYPGIDLAIGHDDNLFLQPTATRSSTFTTVSPYVRAEAKTGPHKFDIGFNIVDGRYLDSSADNYTDYSLTGGAGLVFSGRASLRLNAALRHGHDARGSTDRGIAAVPDEYDNAGIEGVFSYGAPGARGRFEINAGAFARRYTNNRLTTEVSDRDTTALGGTFYWRVMPRTELLAQASFTDIDYRLAASTQDSTESRYLFGVKWEATAKTTGTAKFGRMTKKFDSGTRADVSGASSWDVGVRWSPLTYSVFDFVTSKTTGESTGIGDATVNNAYGVTWSHAWSSRLRTQALVNYTNSTFTGTTGLGREDDTTAWGLRVDYDFRRWLRFGAAYTHSERDSNAAGFNYKRNLLLFTVGATL